MIPARMIALSSFILALAAGQTGSAEDKILGGRIVRPGDMEARYTVALLSMNQDSNSMRNVNGLCTGTLIAQDTILTAAHCVSGATASHLKVVFTLKLQTADPSDFRRVTAFKASPLRLITPFLVRNDIALVHFEGGLKEGYEAAPLLPRNEKLQDSETVTLAGFGLAAHGAQSSIGPLRAVEVDVVDVLRMRRQVRFDQSNLRGACNGDSGGPAFVTRQGITYVWGATSYGTPSCTGPSVYTNASQYAGWIARTMDRLRSTQ